MTAWVLMAGLCLMQAEPAPNLTWVEATSLTMEGQGWPRAALAAPYDRLPAKAEALVRPPVWGLSRDTAGVCANFTTTGNRLYVRWELNSDSLAMAHMPSTGVSGIDVYAKLDTGWRFVGNGQPRQRQNQADFWLPAATQYRVYLPLYNGITSLQLAAAEGHSLQPTAPSTRPLICFYGTSILQGGCASRPGLAATAIAGRTLDVPVINHGYSGNALCEPEMAALLAEIPADIFVVDPLWNIGGDDLRERLGPLVRTLRAAHPNAPILLVEDSQVLNQVPTKSGLAMREILKQLEADGIGGLHFLSAEGMLGTDAEGTVDNVHPNDIGFMRQAEKYVEALTPLIAEVEAARP